MRIFYDVAESTGQCTHECPFLTTNVRVGSTACKKCVFCYGHHNENTDKYMMIPIVDNGQNIYSFKPEKYVYCCFPEKSRYHKISLFFRKLIYKIFG